MAGRWLDWGRVVAPVKCDRAAWVAGSVRSGPRSRRPSEREAQQPHAARLRPSVAVVGLDAGGCARLAGSGGSRSLIPPFFGCVPGEGHVSGRVFILSFFSDRSTEEHSIFWLVDGWQF